MVYDAAQSVNPMVAVLNLSQLSSKHRSKNYKLNRCFDDVSYLKLLYMPCENHHVS